MNKVISIAALAITLASTHALAQAPSNGSAPDNTGANAVPANSAMMSNSVADGQSNLASDLKITQRIRRSVMADKQLSTYAQNVKIVSVNGAVTLNGVVKSSHEKSVIEAKAQHVAGKDKVTSDLTVAPNS